GKDLIHQLIEAAKTIITHVSENEAITSEPGRDERTRSLSEEELSVPRLHEAAFLGTPRARDTQYSMYASEGSVAMGSLSEPTVSDDAAPVKESLKPARTLTKNEIEKDTISNEHRKMAGPHEKPPQTSTELSEDLGDGSATCATDAQYDILLGTPQ